MILDGKIPSGPLHEKWDNRRAEMKLVSPANKRKYRIIVIGTGLAGSSAAASLGELGYNVDAFFFQDSPRRAHSIAAQGGINAAKNYPNDGDSIERLFYDTIKGGDFRSREANVYRLAQLSCNIIDQGSGPGCPLCPGLRRVSRDEVFWRCPGIEDVLCARTDGPAAAARRLRRASAPGEAGERDAPSADRNARPGRGEQQTHKGITVRNLDYRAIVRHAADAVMPLLRRVHKYFFPEHQSQSAVARTQSFPPINAAPTSRTLAIPRSIPPAFPSPANTGKAHTHVRVPAERRPGMGPEQKADTRPPQTIPETERDYFPGAQISPVREILPPAMFLPVRQRKSATTAGASDPAAGAFISISAAQSAGWAWIRSASATATCSRCTNGLPRKTLTSSR